MSTVLRFHASGGVLILIPIFQQTQIMTTGYYMDEVPWHICVSWPVLIVVDTCTSQSMLTKLHMSTFAVLWIMCRCIIDRHNDHMSLDYVSLPSSCSITPSQCRVYWVSFPLPRVCRAWASWQIRQIARCACARNSRNLFPVTEGQRFRHATQHVRHARAVMHTGIAN